MTYIPSLPVWQKGPLGLAATLGSVPLHRHEEPPHTVLLVHGAGSGPWIFEDWADTFPISTLHMVDLQHDVHIPRASMNQYSQAIGREAQDLSRPLAVVAWSMGGLAAMMQAEALDPMCLVMLEPSAPAEVQGWHCTSSIDDPGTFDPQAEYGQFPPGIRSRPESSLARAERKAGISVPTLTCPSLVVSGSEFPVERGSRVAAFYRSDELQFPRFDHWGLVREHRVRAAIAQHLGFAPIASKG
jgi:pimeloyl-ACP methyl ester carboxylesterase